MIPILFKQNWKARLFQLFMAIFPLSFLLFLVYNGLTNGFSTIWSLITWLIVILLCTITLIWLTSTALVGTSCPTCKKWRAGNEQYRHELDKDLIQIFWKCRFCGYKWDTKYKVIEGV